MSEPLFQSRHHARQVYALLQRAHWNAQNVMEQSFDRVAWQEDIANGVPLPEKKYKSADAVDAEGVMRRACNRVRTEALARFGSDQGNPECRTCLEYSVFGGPAHTASPRCRSGRRDHCSCSTCF